MTKLTTKITLDQQFPFDAELLSAELDSLALHPAAHNLLRPFRLRCVRVDKQKVLLLVDYYTLLCRRYYDWFDSAKPDTMTMSLILSKFSMEWKSRKTQEDNGLAVLQVNADCRWGWALEMGMFGPDGVMIARVSEQSFLVGIPDAREIDEEFQFYYEHAEKPDHSLPEDALQL